MPNFFINVKETGARKAEKNVKGLNRSLGSLKSQAMMAAGAFLGTGALIAGIKGAVNAFGEQELAEKKLEASLGRTSQALLDQAAALQQVSNFGDETIISAQALIAAFVDDEEQIKLATQATLDLAAAKGMDLNAAADLVSKTLGSSTNAMSRYGIEVTGAVGSTERLNTLTGNIAEKFGGQALAQSETLTGSIKGMKDAIGDTAEDMGELLAPAVIKAAGFFKGAAEAVGGYVKSLKDLSVEEIQQSTNQDDLAERIGKTKQQLHDLKQANFGAGKSINDTTYWTQAQKDEFQALEDKLFVLEQRYTSTNMLVTESGFNFAESSSAIEEAGIRRTEADSGATDIILGNFKKVEQKNLDLAAGEKKFAEEKKKRKADQVKEDLKNAALSGQSADEAMKSVVRAEIMEAAAGYFSSIFKSVPFPFNIALAAGAGSFIAGKADQLLSQVQIPSFATGGDFVTNGEQLIRVGDNPSGRERVQVTPLDAGGEPTGGGGAVHITFNSPVMSADHTEDVIIPQIREAIRRGASLGVS